MTTAERNELARELLRARTRKTILSRAEALTALSNVYVETSRDKDLQMELEVIISHILNDNVKEGYAIMVVGPSGAGKTTLVNRCLDGTPELQPFVHYDNEVQYCLRVATPSACSVKELGRAILEASGYPLAKLPSEGDIWLTVRNRLPLKMHKIIFFDEFQHVLKGPKAKGAAHLTNQIKLLMQDRDWPVWLIFAGVPQINEFARRDEWLQMDRRIRPIQIDDLRDPVAPHLTQDVEPPPSTSKPTAADQADQRSEDDDSNDIDNTRDILEAMARSCGLRVGFPLTDQFIRRLMHGGIWRFGLTNQIVKLSIECALWDEHGDGQLKFEHFCDGYRRISNCKPRSNVFQAPDWERIRRRVTKENKLTSGFSLRPE